MFILFIWAMGWLPGQTLSVVANNVEYADIVQPGGLPGLKLCIFISGHHYGFKSPKLYVIFNDVARKSWQVGSSPLLEERLVDGTFSHVDAKINPVIDHEYASPIEFQTFEDGKNYRLTVFFTQFSEGYINDVAHFKTSKSEEEKAIIIKKYKKIAEDAQKEIAARHGIWVMFHNDCKEKNPVPDSHFAVHIVPASELEYLGYSDKYILPVYVTINPDVCKGPIPYILDLSIVLGRELSKDWKLHPGHQLFQGPQNSVTSWGNWVLLDNKTRVLHTGKTDFQHYVDVLELPDSKGNYRLVVFIVGTKEFNREEAIKVIKNRRGLTVTKRKL
jgi:hypothetical protein